MMPDFPLGETLDFKFTTRAFATGIPTTLAGSPAVVVYEDNSTTEITAGITLTADFDTRTGLNNLRVVATGGNGYESGKSYAAVISSGTVGGTSVVGEVVAQFTIERSPALRPTVAGRTLDVTTGGEAGIDLNNTTGTISAAQIASNAITSDKIAANAIGSSEFAQAAADKVWSTASRTLTANTNLNDISAADVWAHGTRTLTASLDPTAGEIADAVWDEATAAHVAAGSFGAEVQTHATSAEIAALNDISAADVWTNPTRTLTSGEAPSAAEVADAVWDEPKVGHVAAGTFGEEVQTHATAAELAPLATSAEIAALNDITAADVWAHGTRILTASTNFNDLSAAEVKSQADAALNDIHLDHLFATDYDPDSIPGVAGAWANELTESDGTGALRYTSKALESAPAAGGGFITGYWRWTTDTTATDPGTGRVKVNSATYASVTEVYIHQLSNTSYNAGEVIETLEDGDNLTLAEEGAGGNFLRLDVTGPAVDNGDWYTIPVVVDEVGTAIGNNRTVTVMFGFAEASGTEIAAAVWNTAKASHVAAGTFGEEVQTHATSADIAALNDISAADVWAAGSRTLTDTLDPTAADIADAVWDEAKAGHTAAGSFGEEVQTHATSAEIGALNDLSAADVNAEVVDVIRVDTLTLPGQSAPTATPTLSEGLAWLYKVFRNRKEQTATEWQLFDDTQTVVDAKATVSDDGTTSTKQEIVAGP